MDPSRYGSTASRSVSTEPTGFYRGVVKAVDGDTVTVQVPRLFGGAQIPDVPVAGPGLSVDDPVFVSFIEGRRGALLAFAAAGAAAVGDITSVTAGTNLNGGGTSGAVTVNLESDITLTTVNANLVGNVTGNADTATALETARTINGTSFDGTADITVTAAAGTLTGSTLNSSVTASSLTSVGTLTSLTTSGNIDGPQDFTVGNGEGEFVLFQGSSNQVFFQSNGVYRAYFNSSGHFLPYAHDEYDIGATSLRFRDAFFDTVNTTSSITASGVVTANEFRASDIGPASDAAFTFGGDGDTGMFSGGSNSLSFSTGGTERLVINSSGNVDIAGTLSVDGIVTLGDEIKGGSGSAADPVFTFASDGDTGLYPHAANELGVSAGGTQVARFASNGIRVANGSAATPSYTFINDSNTGFYITGNSGVIYWSGNNNTGGYLFNGGIRTDNGTASTPAYSFTGDTDTGMIRYTTNQIALIAGGVGCLIGAAGTINTAGLETTSTTGYRYVLRNNTYGTLYNFTSSADVKENITNVTASDAAAWIDALQPVTFNERWLQDGTESDEDRAFREADIQVGFIADDVLANSTIAKFAQVEDVDGTLKGVGWKWECVIAAAVAEIKSLRTRVAALEAE